MSYKQNRKFFRTNIAEVKSNESLRNKATFVITPTGSHFLLDGLSFSIERFNQLFPVVLKRISLKGDNPDSRSFQ